MLLNQKNVIKCGIYEKNIKSTNYQVQP